MPSNINASTSSGVVTTADNSGVLNLQTANTTAVTIDTSQNVGIGTTSPTAKLDVAGNGRSGNVYNTGLTIAQPGNSITYPADNTLAFNTISTERMRIDSSGNVGIGTASPAARLEVQGSVRIGNATASGSLTMPDLIGNPSLSLVTDTATAGNCTIVNNWGAASNIGVVVGTTRSDGAAFQVQTAIPITSGLPSGSGTTALYVGGNGNVGIGNTSPTAALSINTTQNAYVTMQHNLFNGRMLGKYFANAGSTGKTINLLTITGFSSVNTRVFVNVLIRWVNPLADQGGAATAWAGASQGGTRTQSGFVASQTWGTSVLGSLSWSGNTLRITTPALTFASGYIDVEYVAFDGAAVTLDTSNQ